MTDTSKTLLNGRYQILKQLAHGAIAETYLAEDTQLKRPVVIKVAFDSHPNMLAVFTREFRVLAKISDPAFAHVYDCGTLPDGRLYMTREYLEGTTLEVLLETNEALATEDALAVAVGLARGLGVLHSVGFIHRDIKPSNIVIPSKRGAPDFADAKLIDFGGLGKLMTKRFSGEHLTRTGEVFGTPHYMAPEQLQGAAQSPATDVYGLALLMARMLYGRLPFEKPDETALSVMLRILREDPDLPVSPTVPDSLRELLIRALSRDPKSRPQNGAIFAAELQEQIQHMSRTEWSPASPAPMRPSAAMVPALAPARSRRVAVGVAVVLAIGALLWIVRSSSFSATEGPGSRLNGFSLLLIAFGIVIAFAGLVLATWLRRAGRSRLHAVDADVHRLLLGLDTRQSLTKTLHLEVRAIIATCRGIDERVLGVTILKMIGEFDRASESDDRQSALMNVGVLLEKLRNRLSPWHARFEKQLALATSVVGVVAGLLSIVTGVLKIANGSP